MPRWRHRRIGLDEIAAISFEAPPSGDRGGRDYRFTMRPFGGGRPWRMWMWTTGYETPRRNERRLWRFIELVRQAIAGRARLLIGDALGLGPWSDAEWAAIAGERRLGGLTRADVVDKMGLMRGEPRLPELGHASEGVPPVSVMLGVPWTNWRTLWGGTTWGGATQDDWRAFLDDLCGGVEVTGRPEWRRRIDGLLRYGEYALSVIPRRRGHLS